MKKIKLILGLGIGLFLVSCDSNSVSNKTESVKNITNFTRQEEVDFIKNLDFSSEGFYELDKEKIKELNQKIVLDSLINIQDFVNEYQGYETSTEGNGSIQLFIDRRIDNDKIEVVSITTGQLDDSVEAIKIIYKFQLIENISFPKLLSIKENYRCYTDSGHTDWDSKLCN